MTPSRRLAQPTNPSGGYERVLLIAADAQETAKSLGELDSLTQERYEVEWVTELSQGVERLREGGVGAAVFDLNLSNSQGIEMFDELFQAASGVPILILSGVETEAIARQAIQRGAQDYLVKEEAKGHRLRRTVRTMMDRRALEARLENEIANITLNSIGEAVLRTDIQHNVTYLNRFAGKITGWRRDAARGRPIDEVLRLIDSVSGATIEHTVAMMKGPQSAKAPASLTNCKLTRRDGVEFSVEYRVTVVYSPGGNIVGTVVAIRDVSATQAASLEMLRIGQPDALTSLANRTLFNDRLTQAILLAGRQGKQLAVLFVDLDQFKRVNDSLGHAVGDELLRSVAGRLTDCVRRSDTVSRLGGDEFLILLSRVEHEEDAAICARKILRAVAKPHIINNQRVDISASIGGSTYPSHGQDAETLVHQADLAMYEVKQQGRNSYQFFRDEMQERLAKRRLLEADLRHALGRNESWLHYQPKVDLQTGRITGMEALIRWQHPEQGLLLPAAFVPIAEECGLILPIGQWVLLEACRQARAWSDSGLGVVPVAVNVSAVEFQAKDFLSGVRAVLIATGIQPLDLELELTETVLMQDAESSVVTLRALRAMGVHLAIDDFGTGYSSFTYLRRFAVDTLKIDQSFVQDLTPDRGGATIVSAMINLGKSLNKRVIAEGVETRSQLDFLQRHGCGEGQGYYLSRPVVAEQAGKLFNSKIHCPQRSEPYSSGVFDSSKPIVSG